MNTHKLISIVAGAVFSGVTLSALSAEPILQARRIVGSGPILNTELPQWQQIKAVPVAMLPQMVTDPKNLNPAVKELKVKAVHNGQWLALLIEWNDVTRDDRVVSDQFGDQVAVELPLKNDPLPNPMMGNPGARVNILQWRAAFQHDIEKGEPKMTDLYPNAVVDLYPDQVLRATDARPYTGALGMDNPISRGKESPVLDQMAEGWGTMTVKPDQHADGKGVWKNGVWRVVITTPLVTESVNSPRLAPGSKTMTAFAIWDGGHKEVGSRKAWSSWVPLELLK